MLMAMKTQASKRGRTIITMVNRRSPKDLVNTGRDYSAKQHGLELFRMSE